MTAFIGIFCFAIGLCAGAVLFRQFKSDAAKVDLLEQKLKSIQTEHDSYQESVHNHFSTTVQLINNLTDSYREVYRQLASSSQELCPESISSQLSLSSQAYDLLASNDEAPTEESEEEEETLFPPRDYSPKTSPDQKGNLADDYGLDKVAEKTEPSPT